MLVRVLVLAILASTQFQTLETTVRYQNKDAPPLASNSVSKVGRAGCTMELLSDTDGVDFNPYLRELHLAVKKRWFANMPPSIEKGQQGKNTVEFRVCATVMFLKIL